MGCFFVAAFFFGCLFFYCSLEKKEDSIKNFEKNESYEMQKMDSIFNFHLNKISTSNNVDSLLIINKAIDSIFALSKNQKKKYYLYKMDSIKSIKAIAFFEQKKNSEAHKIIESIHESFILEKKDTLQYINALAIKNVKNEKDCAAYLSKISNKTDRLQTLENQVNPPKKIFSHYQALCNDGFYKEWTSTRQGTCNRHGGVNKWNGKAIYLEKRKYQF